MDSEGSGDTLERRGPFSHSMKHLLTILLCGALALCTPLLTSCETTSAGQSAFTSAAAQTASYFAGLEVLTKADSEADWAKKRDVVTGLVIVLQGINRNTTDPVQIRELFTRYFAGKPAHWAALSTLVVSWINTRATFEGRSELINSIISGLTAAAGMPYAGD